MVTQTDILERQDIHLLVVDDDDRIRDLLKRYLSRQGFRVTSAANAAGARRLMQTFSYDCMILDVMMPGEDGFALTESLRTHSDIPIILLTARGDAADRISGLKHGADDYLAKPFEPEELVLRIEGILRRLNTSAQATSHIVNFGPWEFDTDRQSLTKNGDSVRLTTGEAALLTTLGRRAGVTVTREALAETIGAKSERAVDVQITRLRRKIEDTPSDPDHLMTVRGKGYRLLTSE